MSQAKVDNYKKSKANRQKIMKREKIMHRLEMVCMPLSVWFSLDGSDIPYMRKLTEHRVLRRKR